MIRISWLTTLVVTLSIQWAYGYECKPENIQSIPVEDCGFGVINQETEAYEGFIEHPLRDGYVEHCPGVVSHVEGGKFYSERKLEAHYEAVCHDSCGNPYTQIFIGSQNRPDGSTGMGFAYKEGDPDRFNRVVNYGTFDHGGLTEKIQENCYEDKDIERSLVLSEFYRIRDHIKDNIKAPDWTHEIWPNTPLFEETVVKGAKKFKYRDQGNALLVEIKGTSKAQVYYLQAILANENFSQMRYPISGISVSVGGIWALEHDQSFAANTSMGFQIVKNEPALFEDETNLMVGTIKKLEDKGTLIWDNLLLEGKNTPVAFNGSGEMLGIQILVPLKKGVGFDIYDYMVVKEDQETTFKRVAETSRVLQFGSGN